MALSSDLGLLIVAQALHGASFGAVHLAAMHHLRDRVPAELQASAQGFYAGIGHALLLGLITPVAGWLYAERGGQAFWAMAALALAGTASASRLRCARPWGVSVGHLKRACRLLKGTMRKCRSDANARRMPWRSIRTPRWC